MSGPRDLRTYLDVIAATITHVAPKGLLDESFLELCKVSPSALAEAGAVAWSFRSRQIHRIRGPDGGDGRVWWLFWAVGRAGLNTR